MTDPAFLSLSEAAAAIARRKVSSVELTQACLARMERLGARLNCIAAVDAEAALGQARKADRELKRGRKRGPLHGVPLAHKDMYYRKGRVSGCGSRIRKDFVPDHTATVLERLDAAGALDIARLNMVEFALGITGHNEITGHVRNPWNPAHITGGSSSGSASAVAARLVYGTLGSDTGGSIRFPAACCGLVGIKATNGRVSRHGAMPLSFSFDNVGPLARTTRDAALILQTIAGFDERDPTSSRRPVGSFLGELEKGAKGLRVGVPENYFYDSLAPEAEKPVRASLEVLRRAGARLVSVRVPDSVSSTNAMTTSSIVAEGAGLHARWLRERPQDYGTQTRGRLMLGMLCPASRYVEMLNLRAPIAAEFVDAVFAKADVLHTPVLPVEVPTIAETDMAANPGFLALLRGLGHATRPFSFMGLPAISVPCGFTANGLPASFQLAGRPFDEATLFRVARAYERECDWHARAPEL
jgi:aspartyl-tRNA(Asn)/glutamyl-tRNA(Gln) amidotransferase subunit A